MIIRIWLLAIWFCALGGVFIGRLVQLQLVRGARYDREIREARLRVDLIPTRRGRLLDRRGRVLVDNRASYHAAVVLADLEKPFRERRRTPFIRIDEHAVDLMALELSTRLDRDAAKLRRILVEELLLFPGVAVRRGDSTEGIVLGLVALPGEQLIRAERGEVDNDPAWARLAQSGLLEHDPRRAVEREYLLRRDQVPILLEEAEYAAACGQLAATFEVPEDHLLGLLEPFASVVGFVLPGEGGGHPCRWRLLEEDRLGKAATVLARYVGRSSMAVLADLQAVFPRFATGRRDLAWLFVPGALEPELGRLLPAAAQAYQILITGAPPGYRRVFLLQDDTEDELRRRDGLLDLFLARLETSLGLHASTDWLGAIIEHHGRRATCRELEREFRKYLLVFSPALVRRTCTALAAELAAGGMEDRPPLAIERALTMARRIADRDWRDHTRHDPLPLVLDVPYPLAQRLASLGATPPPELAVDFLATEPPVPGLSVTRDMARHYLYPGSSSHLIGYLGRLSSIYDHETALAMGMDPAGWIGRSGLEYHYDEILQGDIGKRVRLRTPDGYRLVERIDPVPGKDLELELDIDLQLTAEQALGEWFELARALDLATPKMEAAVGVGHGRAGMALMDVETGGLLVLASRPGYDLREVRRRYAELADPERNPGRPLHDHASEAAQPCGSSMKPLVALAALAQDKVGLHEEIFSKGYMAISGGRRILREHEPYSPRSFTVATALQKSSNVFFATLGERLGGATLSHYQSLLGLGRNNAIDVAWQRPGILPTPENLPRLSPREPRWTPYRSWSQAIGQGLSSAPVQMVCVPACVANGGRVLRPHLRKGAPLAHPEDPVRLDLTAAELGEVRRGMELVCAPGGTAPKLEFDTPRGSIAVAAKTGTAEWGTLASRSAGLTPDHAWLIGYAPAERPRVAFAIFVHSGTSGGRACTGVAKAVLEEYFRRYPDGH